MASSATQTNGFLLSVVADLESFALSNSLPDTARALRSVYRTARTEIGEGHQAASRRTAEVIRIASMKVDCGS